MLRIKLKYLLLVAPFLFTGCDKSGNASLENKLEASNAQIATLQEDLKNIKLHNEVNDVVSNSERVAYLTPGSDGYSAVKFDLGVLTVQLADVTPYANGSKVSLRFGNILSASINGLKTKIDWGRVDAKGMPTGEQKSKEFTFIQSLRAGAWTAVPIVLEGIPPNELGFVRVYEVTHTGINLYR